MPDAVVQFEMEKLTLRRQLTNGLVAALRLVLLAPLAAALGLMLFTFWSDQGQQQVLPVFVVVMATFSAVQYATIWYQQRAEAYYRDVERALKKNWNAG